MNKRLRKKKHRGEFAEWGRRLLATRNTRESADAFHDAFIAEAIEANGRFCGGSLSSEKIEVIELGRKSDDPEARFAKVAAWLDARPDMEGWRAGPLLDLRYGDCEDVEGVSEQQDQHAKSSRKASMVCSQRMCRR